MPSRDALHDAIIVDFPLRGSGWTAVTTPAERIPSHGTDLLGQRFAYDFVQVDHRPGFHAHPAPTWRMLLSGAPTREFYGWGQPIHAPCDAEVIRVVDGVRERGWVHPAREAARTMHTAATFRPESVAQMAAVLGNHVILRAADHRGGPVFVGLGHLQRHSAQVRSGQRVRAGEFVGRVGHSGNSTMPHLHLQLMDSADLRVARGLPCAFASYDVVERPEEGRTIITPVTDGIPKRFERLIGRGPAGVGRA
ncbi:M23 family metallopeptidase [Ruania alkalisoli]|uniref:M23 family metallopeptidase n=1 Tax=Ruania alkalisoli TaxID=2779775 RepID=A0A7M1SPE9_9MICO|nr:M23 family metallopeptidase [Ruania alkalisoli]QOR69311.1 M23 family metallopeptidase [Ruania alkalisoli]